MDRTEHIRHILEDKVSKVGADEVYRNDPQYHAQIYQLVHTLTMVDEAMEKEGINQTIRDNVLDICFTGISEQAHASARLAKAQAAIIDVLSGWDKDA